MQKCPSRKGSDVAPQSTTVSPANTHFSIVVIVLSCKFPDQELKEWPPGSRNPKVAEFGPVKLQLTTDSAAVPICVTLRAIAGSGSSSVIHGRNVLRLTSFHGRQVSCPPTFLSIHSPATKSNSRSGQGMSRTSPHRLSALIGGGLTNGAPLGDAHAHDYRCKEECVPVPPDSSYGDNQSRNSQARISRLEPMRPAAATKEAIKMPLRATRKLRRKGRQPQQGG